MRCEAWSLTRYWEVWIVKNVHIKIIWNKRNVSTQQHTKNSHLRNALRIKKHLNIYYKCSKCDGSTQKCERLHAYFSFYMRVCAYFILRKRASAFGQCVEHQRARVFTSHIKSALAAQLTTENNRSILTWRDDDDWKFVWYIVDSACNICCTRQHRACVRRSARIDLSCACACVCFLQ